MHISIIMPVLNEAAVLDTQLAALTRQCTHNDYELLIVDGGSRDDTILIAQRYGRVISAPRSRATQMNIGATQATGDALLFLHADTLLPDNALEAIELALKYPQIVGGAFQLRFDNQNWPYRLVAFSTNLRSRLQTIFTGDQAYFIRSSSFQTIGGYPDQPLMEDLEIISRLRKIGKLVLLPLYVTTSARRHQHLGLLRSILFMWYLRILYQCGVTPNTLQKMYRDIR